MRRQEFNDGTVQLATRIPKQLHVRVRVHAIDSGMTLAEWIHEALTDHLKTCKREARRGPVTAEE
jgi:predicted HicB family RNase H-like nuclease